MEESKIVKLSAWAGVVVELLEKQKYTVEDMIIILAQALELAKALKYIQNINEINEVTLQMVKQSVYNIQSIDKDKMN